MTPMREPTIEPEPGDPEDTVGEQEPGQARRHADGLRGAGGPIQAVEAQVLVDGEPVTVTEAVGQQPGETNQQARARAVALLREDARQVRHDPWGEPHHDDPDPQTTPRRP